MRTTFLCLVLTLGCGDDDRRRSDDTGPQGDVPSRDTGCDPEISIRLPTANVSTVDLLLVIDNTNSMSEEQASLLQAFPSFIASLARGVRDLNVGVVSSDLGTGGFEVPTCDESNFGDDGFLSRETSGAGCLPISVGEPPYLSFRPANGDSPGNFANEVACISNIGTEGCGFTQPLDAMLKAALPASSPIEFVNGSRGHGDEANEGFLREDAILAVLVFSDGDDCSALDPDVFNRSSSTYTDPDLNLRCSLYGDEALHPIDRYVDGLLSLRSPEKLVFMALAGVPVDLAPTSAFERPDWGALIGDESVRDPRMLERPNPTMPSQLSPSCQTSRGVAFPPVRLVGLAQGIDLASGSGSVQSICQNDYSAALTLFAEQVLTATAASCLPRPLQDRGASECQIVETLPSGGCDGAGRVSRGVDDMGRTTCTVCEGDASGALIDANPACQALGTPGWVYNDNPADCPEDRRQRIEFLAGAEPAVGGEVRLVCPNTMCL